MGGFVFDNSRNPESHPLDRGQDQVTMTRELLEWLAENEPDVIPDISSRHITDKSKANGLAKLLVCVQAAYFGLQTIVRLCQGLAVTLLELNVFAHVVCALLTYAFWWNKPLDIDEPTAIYTDDPKAASICAAFWSRANMGNDTPLVIQRRGQRTTLTGSRTLRNLGISVSLLALSPQRVQELQSQYLDVSSAASQQGGRCFSSEWYSSGDILLQLDSDWRTYHDVESRLLIELDTGSALVRRQLDQVMCYRVDNSLGDRIYAAFTEYNLQRYLCAYRHPAGLKVMSLDWPKLTSRTLRPRISNWSWFQEDDKRATQVGLFTTASVLYGAWHLIAWNGPFRTAAEGILWKVSAVGVSVSLSLGEALLFLVYEGYFELFTTNIHLESIPGLGKLEIVKASKALNNFIIFLLKTLYFLSVGLCGLTFCLLIFSRIYLVVESFISLAFVPDTVFALPQWSFYIPHIG